MSPPRNRRNGAPPARESQRPAGTAPGRMRPGHAGADALADGTRVLAGISHELRTPIHGMLGLARLMRDEIRALPSQARLLRRLRLLEQTGQRLLTLVEDALDVADLESAAPNGVHEPFDLAAVVAAVSAATAAAAAEKGLVFEPTGMPSAPAWVLGDAARVTRVLRRLADNAVAFTNTGCVALHVEAGERTVRFDIADTGDAIPGADIARILAAFDAGDAALALRYGAAGVGVAACSALVRSMGGTLAYRAADGGGSVFSFCLDLPRVPAAAALPAHPDGRHAAGGAPARRVLLVEDNALNAMVATAMLHSAAVEVDLATDGLIAVELACTRRYELILMDCQLPELDGFGATRRIREHERERGRRPVPIVALTANSSHADRRRSHEVGMNDHVTKPFSEVDMAALLQRYACMPAHD